MKAPVHLFLTLAAAISATGTSAREVPAIELQRDTLPDNVRELSYHFRVSPGLSGETSLTVRWGCNMPDFENGELRLDIRVPATVQDDAVLKSKCRYKLTLSTGERDSIISSESFKTNLALSPAGFSVVLNHSRGGTSVEFGGEKAAATVELNPQWTPASYIVAESTRHLPVLRKMMRLSELDPVRMCRFADVAELESYLKTSTDPHEGLWTYLDRDMDHTSVSLGGNYMLATVKEGDAYDIIMIHGAEAYSAAWPALRVKGRLRPTVFMHHFDLDWTDASGSAVKAESSATILEGTILTLSFPLLKTAIRFSKSPIR